LSYLQFLLIFVVAPTALLLAYHGPLHIRPVLIACGCTAIFMLLIGVPWLHALIELGIWGWDADKVQATAWDVPIEAAAFFALQAIFTGVLAAIALRRPWWRN
jgi:lycopene cyclase domain-containing protein